ncbi:hypothetical protein FF38_04220 [Lucilia cuprina]|uniref:Uncharacterized protein n=1 Tax=Lucilia cuprina TaxID=7375 RepID=A0A0L0BNP3_LUCCU|nr:hypothetical protein FF38_04220 [Lucilia cuprina]
MVRTSLRKDELVQYLEEFDLDANGTVEEMRKRFATFISGEHKEKVLTRLEEREKKHGRCQTPTTPGMSTQLDVPTRMATYGNKNGTAISLRPLVVLITTK